MLNFTPDNSTPDETAVPFIEDARADSTPYYASRKSPESVIEEIKQAMLRLDGYVTRVQPGIYGTGNRKRHGYEIHFFYRGASGVIRVAGLPIRTSYRNPKKVEQVKTQALCIARDWIQNWLTQKVFNPGYDPLVPFLLVDGRRTVVETVAQSGQLPQLGGGAVVDGEFEEVRGA